VAVHRHFGQELEHLVGAVPGGRELKELGAVRLDEVRLGVLRHEDLKKHAGGSGACWHNRRGVDYVLKKYIVLKTG
jgi:hypothetical protein